MAVINKVTYKDLQQSSHLDGDSSSYLEQLYTRYTANPFQVPSDWQTYFSTDLAPVGAALSQAALVHEKKQMQVVELIESYRLLGHLEANIDPLNLYVKKPAPELMLSYYQLSESDLNTIFNAEGLPGTPQKTLKDIVDMLKTIYGGTVASEYMHIPDAPERYYLREQIEKIFLEKKNEPTIRRHILERLIAAEGLEKYLGSKYPGAKRFSLEGTDTLIILLDECIQKLGAFGAKEIVIGMTHRGRLNVLVNLLGKNTGQLFDLFEGKHEVSLESGDVKYHQGFYANLQTAGGPVHIYVAFNPSHLEIVSPVVCGSVRARQERRNDHDNTEVIPILIHGDASFSGQGVVMETLNMSHTRGFGVGGTIHIVVNNQIGFTTSHVEDARSTLYCSDIGKMMEIPIFHVNADDPEAAIQVITLATNYRNKFKKDVIIDLIGYRRQGHNEADEPAVTQPMMYNIIRHHPTVFKQYADKLIQENVITETEVSALSKNYRDALDLRQECVAKNVILQAPEKPYGDWGEYLSKQIDSPVETKVPLTTLQMLAKQLEIVPNNFTLHPRVQKIVDDRRKMTEGTIPLDWGYGETLAYATILNNGYSIRLCGQDTSRGTFFHRHAVWHDQKTGEEYTPLMHLSDSKGHFSVVDSLLSEEAVLGFEYGYSGTVPKTLTLWEAQFGDFANNAQVVVDQFISTGEQKWGRLSGIVLLLPHGQEGQGPEHSSARLERYLQLCEQNNMQVCVPSTPAQMFHLLRRQILRTLRKPLIVLTPKSFLRHKLAVSSLQELSTGGFRKILEETDSAISKKPKRVVFCGGKVYYDLLEKRIESKRQDIALIRMEQLYPFPETELKSVLEEYATVKDIVWCQEEPQNQGAWGYLKSWFLANLVKDQQLRYVGRQPQAAPSVGYVNLHEAQQQALVKEALQ